MRKIFRHDLPSVEDYLHHRSPYLLVDEIANLHDTCIETSRAITGNEGFIAGHFPGAAIVPGAIMQEMTTQSAGILIAARHNPMQDFDTHDPFHNSYALGVLVKVTGARFRGFARPGETLKIRVELVEALENLFEFRGRVSNEERVIMSNSFQLANIPSTVLQGVEPQSA